jgi:hypothetical protein
MNERTLLGYVRSCPAPTHRRGEIVIMDSLPAHKAAGTREAIEARGPC